MKSLLEELIINEVNAVLDNSKLLSEAKKKSSKKVEKTPQKKSDPDLSDVSNRVFFQLQQDFPPDQLDWVKKASWKGPIDVPTDSIDSSGRKRWQASQENKKVEKFVEKIKRGQLKPIILVKTPKKDKTIIVDGHHRFLAYEKLGIPVCAFVGEVDKAKGPWDTLHDSQRES